MQLVLVESDLHTLKNAAVDKKALGKRIEHLRREKFGTQAKLAEKARVAPNTVRGLEKGKLDTRGPQMQRIFRALGTTLEELVRGEEVGPTDPLLHGLSREDLMIARSFHDAMTAVRVHVSSVLRNGAVDDKSIELVARLMRLSSTRRTELEMLIASSERIEQETASSAVKAAEKK